MNNKDSRSDLILVYIARAYIIFFTISVISIWVTSNGMHLVGDGLALLASLIIYSPLNTLLLFLLYTLGWCKPALSKWWVVFLESMAYILIFAINEYFGFAKNFWSMVFPYYFILPCLIAPYIITHIRERGSK